MATNWERDLQSTNDSEEWKKGDKDRVEVEIKKKGIVNLILIVMDS